MQFQRETVKVLCTTINIEVGSLIINILITLIHGKFIHLFTDLSGHQFIFIDVRRRDTIDNILVSLPYRARFIVSIGHFFQYLYNASVSEIRHKCFFASLNMTYVLNWSATLNLVQSPTDDAYVQKKTFDFITDSSWQLNTMWICLQTHESSRGLHHHAVLHPSILDFLHAKSSSRKHFAMITSLQQGIFPAESGSSMTCGGNSCILRIISCALTTKKWKHLSTRPSFIPSVPGNKF